MMAALEKAQQALEEARTLGQLQQVDAGLAATLHWARRQDAVGLEIVNKGELLRFDTQARLAEALDGAVLGGKGGRPKPSQDVTVSAHAELGIHRQEHDRWKKVAAVPAETRERMAAEATAAGRELTQSAALHGAGDGRHRR